MVVAAGCRSFRVRRGCLLLIGETALYCFLSFLAPSDEFTC